MAGPIAELSPIIAATAHWLVRAYPPAPGAFAATIADQQARQAVTVAAWLRYPTPIDAGLLSLVGPGGAGRLDGLVGLRSGAPGEAAEGWRTWVDEVLASWAACLLADPDLAAVAVRAALQRCDHTAGLPSEFRRLTVPHARDRAAAALLRHPDLLAPVAALHRAALLALLDPGVATGRAA